jgi:hypothetical protein
MMSSPHAPTRSFAPALAAAGPVLAVLAYAATVRFGFAYDDVDIVARNTLLHDLRNWRAILASTWWADAGYRPFTLLSLALDWRLGGGAPWVFHATNVALHAAVTGGVFALLHRPLGPIWAGVAAAFFAVHPVHVEAVANVVGRAELLAAAGVVGAALAYRADADLAAAGDTGWRRAAAGLGTLVLIVVGLASKEIAFAAPGVFLLVDWLDGASAARPPGAPQVDHPPSAISHPPVGGGGEAGAARFRRHWLLWTATVLVTAGWLWLWVQRSGELGVGVVAPGLVGEGLPGRAVAMTPVVLHHLRLLVFPLDLSVDYSPNHLTVVPRLTVTGALGAAVAILTLVAAWWARRRAPVVTFGLLWTAGTLLVVSNVLVPGEVILAERTLYLPSVGAVAVLGWLPSLVPPSWRRAALVVASVVVALGAARTVTRAPVWRNSDAVFRQFGADAPGSYRAAWVAGMLAYEGGDRRSGENLLRQAASVYPLNPGLWLDLAARVEEDRRWAEAARFYQAAFTVDPRRIDAAAYAVVNLVRAGRLDSAEALVARAAARDQGGEFRLDIARGDLAMARGRPLEAMTWRRAVALEFPGVWQYWHLTAEAALAAGYCPEIERSVGRVRELRDDPELVERLAARGREAGCGG